MISSNQGRDVTECNGSLPSPCGGSSGKEMSDLSAFMFMLLTGDRKGLDAKPRECFILFAFHVYLEMGCRG